VIPSVKEHCRVYSDLRQSVSVSGFVGNLTLLMLIPDNKKHYKTDETFDRSSRAEPFFGCVLSAPRMLSGAALLASLAAATFVAASPINGTTSNVQARQSLTSLTPEQIAAFRPFSHYAATAACDPSVVSTWTCGGESFHPLAFGVLTQLLVP
jgi:hypothetical protein